MMQLQARATKSIRKKASEGKQKYRETTEEKTKEKGGKTMTKFRRGSNQAPDN
jgi:hypothetical protein